MTKVSKVGREQSWFQRQRIGPRAGDLGRDLKREEIRVFCRKDTSLEVRPFIGVGLVTKTLLPSET